MVRYMMEAYGAGAATIPKPPRANPSTRATELFAFFAAVAAFYGLDFGIPDPGDIDPNLESMFDIVTVGTFSQA
jgi:hypothetical protein